MKEVNFSQEQLDCIENILNSDVKPFIEKEIKENYIHRALPEGMLKKIKKEKEKNVDKARKLYLQGAEYVLEFLLKED